ncbi:MAG: hypothetical protein J5824_08115, partial [Lachnospiraceae bacterium]|nr:hypothetical protein [Lachnospiraceae bacterium]
MKEKRKNLKRLLASCTALLLAFSMVIPSTGITRAHAEENVTATTPTEINNVSELFKVSEPADLKNLPNSAYDNIGSTPFLLSEQNELYFLSSRNKKKTVDIFDTANLTDYYMEVKTDNENWKNMNGNVLKNGINVKSAQKYTSVTNGLDYFQNLDFAQGVAFDPTGSGRKDHIAVVGLGVNITKEKKKTYYNYFSKVVVQNTITGASYEITLDTCNWMRDMELWYAGSYFSITAGDYDHDGKDSVMVYVSADTVFNIYEIELSGSTLTKSAVLDVRAQVTSTRAVYGGTDPKPNLKPIVSITTGDFDSDGRDE